MDDKNDVTPRGAVSNKRQRFSNVKTDKDRRVNPFEREWIQKVRGPFVSPMLMQCPVDTPPQYDWGIDEISKLNPTKIEESPSSHQESESLSQEVEEKVQADIHEFFINHPLPSPVVKESKDKCVGTDISFPLHLPEHIQDMLNSFLCDGGADSTKSSIEEDDESKLMNTSLRRKLDFNSFEEGMDDNDMSLKSDDFNIVQHHGKLILSPNAYRHPAGQSFLSPMSTPVGSSPRSCGNMTQEMICSTPSS